MHSRWLSLSLLSLAACGSARAGVPLAGPLQLSANAQHGQVLFMRHCNQCHPGGEAGIGTAINNKPVPHVAEKLQIREGVLGIMPKFPESVISDGDVDLIIAYLDALQEHHQ
jgi:mono/diheme cytochrome c family protein